MKILIVLLVLLVSSSMGQVTEQWVQRYNGPGYSSDGGSVLKVDNAGNVFILGTTSDGPTTDFITIKYNSSGIMQWLQIYNGTGNNVDRGSAIAIDQEGNVYVTGFSTGAGSRYDYATIKYDSLGIMKWVQRFNGPTSMDDMPAAIAIDNLGNIYITGWCSAGALFDDYATLKYNSEGVLQWIQRYNGTGSNQDQARSIAIDITGNVYVTGSSYGITSGYDYATVKYNPLGDSLWVRRYNGQVGGADGASLISIDPQGNIIVAGNSEGSNLLDTNSDFVTIKYNSAGVQQWAQRYSGPSNRYDDVNALDVDVLGNVYITGLSNGFVTSWDYATVKYSPSGVRQWVQRYAGFNQGGADVARSISVDDAGNVYVTGLSAGDIFPNEYDYATLKYNSAGVVQWIQRYNGPSNRNDQAYSLALDLIGNVYVTGESYDNGTGMDIVTIKYSQTIGIQQISTNVPEGFELSQNYPNPFNPVTNINFSIPKSCIVKLTVFDASGRETARLFNGRLSAGKYNYDFDASGLASGIYFYKLESGDFIQTKKMVLIK
jgi:uncharacterized delta-60 repeat protein